MSHNGIMHAYAEIYNNSLTEEVKKRATDPAAREAARKRLELLQKDKEHNPYVKQKTPGKFGKYVDAWNALGRVDGEFEKHYPNPDAYHPKHEKSPTKPHRVHYGRHMNQTLENVEHLVDYLLNEGYASNESDANVLCKHMSEEWMNYILTEMRKQDKVAGKTSGGNPDPAYRQVKKFIRSQEGTPAGQRKKVPGQKPPRAGEYGGPMSPEKKIAIRRANKKEAEAMQSSRFD